MSSREKDPTRFRQLAWFTLVYTLGVILWGAYVRATGSGAGCGEHWPLCNGEILPRAPVLETVIEFTHRLTSGLCLVLVVWLSVWASRVFPKNHPARVGAYLSLFFTLTEAALGAGLVLLQLVAQDDSVARAWAISSHLVNTFLLLAAMTYTAITARKGERFFFRRRDPVWTVVLISLLGFILVGASGAIVALGDTLFPASSLAEGLRQDFAADAHFLLRLRVWHPVLAVSVTCLIGLTGVYLRRVDPRPAVQNLSLGVTLMAVTQIALGFANLALLAPVWMQMVHLLVADLTWILLVSTAGRTLLHASPAFSSELSSSSGASSRISSDFLRPSVRLKN